jgi:hypothetical protein
MTVSIKAKKNLYNSGRCFTKGNVYTFDTYKTIVNTYSLIECIVTNDLGEPHIIGNYHKNFIIL